MTECEVFARSKNSVIVAPAGCGKTHLIAQSVANYNTGKELILTHTHAGVDALRRKLKRLNVPTNSFQVETIAGFALRYASAFPHTSGLETALPTGKAWNNVYGAALNLLKKPPIQRVLRSSYSGVYVDEYQDCIIQQHEIILQLSKLLPCRILGDPLQGIFDFKGNRIVDWSRDVAGSFSVFPELTTPWRWKTKNPDLGAWLQDARIDLLKEKVIDLRWAPVRWIQLSENPLTDQINACFKALKDSEGTAVAIHKWANQCHKVCSCLRGTFTCMETIECGDLLDNADKIDLSEGVSRIRAVIAFAASCMTIITSELSSVCQSLSKGKLPSDRIRKHRDQVTALLRIAGSSSPAPVLEALDSLKNIPGVIVYRRELYNEMKRALRALINEEHQSLREAAWHVRDKTRRRGRFPEQYVIGRTLIVKGSEYDHAIILDAEDLRYRELYVAMTRGAKSLTILSKKPIIQPKYE